MYRKIILPADGSEASRVAVEYGLKLAKFHGAAVVIVSVMDLAVVYPVLGGPVTAELVPQQLEETKALLERLKDEALRMGVEASTVVRRGDPGFEIVAVAREQEADLILMAAHQHGRIAALLLGSVSKAILRAAPCPVLVIGTAVIAGSPELQAAAAAARGTAVPTDPEC